MKNIILYFLLSLFLFSCGDDRNINKAEFLKDCFTENERGLINEGILIFEEIYMEKYQLKDPNEIYVRFLEDIKMINLDMRTLIDSRAKAYIKKLKNSSVFNMIYTNEDRDDMTDKMRMQQEDRLALTNRTYHYMNPDGKFLNCLISKSKDQGYTDFLKALKREPQISPDMIVDVFMRQFGPEFTKSSSAQTLIVFKIYYEFVLMDFK